MKKISTAFYLLFFLTTILFAQSLDEDLQNFANESGIGYVKPLNYALNSAVNSGLFNSAKSLHLFQFEFTVTTNFTLIPDSDKTFIAHRPEIEAMGVSVYTPEEVETATIFGDQGNSFNVSADFMGVSNLDDINLPDGLNISVMPFIIPQINMGLPFGFEMGLRYFPLSAIDSETFKDSYFYGVGLKYNPDLPLPINLSFMGFVNSVNVGEVVSVKTFAGGLIASKKLLNYEFYANLNYCSSSMKVDYKTETVAYQPPTFVTVPVNIKFTLNDSSLKPRFGINYTILFFKFNVDVSLGKYTTYNFGISVRTP